MKICCTCKIEKSLEDFYNHRRDGKSSSCIPCSSLRRKQLLESKTEEEISAIKTKRKEYEKRLILEGQKNKTQVLSKICSSCKKEKVLDGFYNKIHSKDGKTGRCKECITEECKQYRKNNKEKRSESSKKYYYKNVEKISKYHKEYNIKNGVVTGTGETIPEKTIRLYLEQNSIEFEQEYCFRECRNHKGNLLSFDFFLLEHNLVIEYNGPSHYEPIFGEDRLKGQQQNDQIKVEFCKAQNIELLILKDNNFEPLYKIFEKS